MQQEQSLSSNAKNLSVPQAWSLSSQQPVESLGGMKNHQDLKSVIAIPQNTLQPDRRGSDFFRQSTCSALVHFGDRPLQSACLKFIWFAALIGGIVCAALSTYHSGLKFFRASGTSETLIEKAPHSRFEYPKFHICTSDVFNVSILAAWGLGDAEMMSYLQISASGLGVSPTLLTDTSYQLKLQNRFESALSIYNLTVEKIFKQALLKCEEIVTGCMILDVHLGGSACCEQYFSSSSFPGPNGACISTNTAHIYQLAPGLSFGFVVVVRNRSPVYPLDNAIVNPRAANQRAVFFTASDKRIHPYISMLKDPTFVRSGLFASLAVSKTITNDEELNSCFVSKKKCVRRKEEASFHRLVPGFRYYSQINCIYAARQMRLAKYFNCTLLGLPSPSENFTACKPHQLVEITKRFMEGGTNESLPNVLYGNDGCLSDCLRESYSITASSAELVLGPNFKMGNRSLESNESSNLVMLNFYYPIFTYTHLVNHYPTLNEWLGIVGGNFGLFLGASMVTIVELIVFGPLLCTWICSRRRS